VHCVSLGLAFAIALGLQPPPRPSPMPTLPLTQLDERSPAADLDNRTFTLTFAQPVGLRELLLLIVRGTSMSVVADPGVTGSFIGELKNVTLRQALSLILQPLGFDFRVDGTLIRVVRREADTRIFDVNYIASVRAGEAAIGGVSTSIRTDLFADILNAVKQLLSQQAMVSLDRKAGLLQVTDFPERLDRVTQYLDAMQVRVLRQIQIDVQLVEVELTDEKATGIDWRTVRTQLVGTASAAERGRRALTGLRVTDVARLLEQLAAQGKTTTLATPTLLSMTNEPAIVKTDALTVTVTAAAAGDGAIMLDVVPVIAAPIREEMAMLARVADGETLVLAGFTIDREFKETKNLGRNGGWFGRGTVVTHKKVELVLLLTPRVVVGVNAQ
jgi:type II secretory pathway component GspD/PulD (secretin)